MHADTTNDNDNGNGRERDRDRDRHANCCGNICDATDQPRVCLTFELGLDYFGCSIHLSSLVPRPNLASAQNTKTEETKKEGSQHNEMVAWSAADWTRIVYSTIRIGVGGRVGKREVNVFNKGNKVCTTCE